MPASYQTAPCFRISIFSFAFDPSVGCILPAFAFAALPLSKGASWHFLIQFCFGDDHFLQLTYYPFFYLMIYFCFLISFD
jgi:hypothetical protein